MSGKKMVGDVLKGGRSVLRTRGRVAYLALVWLPVLVMLLVIARESTAGFGSAQTSAFLRPILEGVLGPIANDRWDTLHHLLRKTGHFLGYGLLGLTWLRAWLYVWLMPLRFRGIWQWRGLAWRMAIACTAIVAGLDELHQTWIPDRTGMATDVLLDTAGAIAVSGMLWLWWRREVTQ